MSRVVLNKQAESFNIIISAENTAVESYLLVLEAYGEYVSTERTCENLSKISRYGDFDVKDQQKTLKIQN